MKSEAMDSSGAAEHLQIIRTLMERSAVYRRALAPIMLGVGLVGLVGAGVGILGGFHSNQSFALLWLITAGVAVIYSYLLARRQAIRAREIFWSPPARRVTEALFPPLFAGAVVGVALAIFGHRFPLVTWVATAFWVILYGCALNGAGFFTLRGIRLFGASLIFIGVLWLMLTMGVPRLRSPEWALGVMGSIFGLLHVLYGGYLYLTERKGA